MSLEHLYLHRLLRKEVLPFGQIKIGYVMGETVSNQWQSLEQAHILLKQGVIEIIAIPDPLPPYDYGYLGPDYCKQILIKAGVREDRILTISPNTHRPAMNTQTELEMVAGYLKETKYEGGIVIIAPWFHVLRSYITALSEFRTLNPNIKVFMSSVSLDPYEETIHSQGIQKGTRRQIFREEVGKCDQYKNLIPIELALAVYKAQRNVDK